MEVLTLYVGQGNFAVIRHGTQAIAVDTRWLAERSEDIESNVDRFLRRRELVGVVLTGFDDDHADPVGLDWLLEKHTPNWVMYPKYYKDTENAKAVFNVIQKHERWRKRRANPLKRVSVRLDRLKSRYLVDLAKEFDLELFSPHIEDMDNSNNCSIVLKVEGIGPGGFSYLVTGDTEIPRWDRIVELFDDALDSDVLAAPHHGSKNAAHAGMARAVMPNTVLISAGVDNQYGHPDKKAVNLYLRFAFGLSLNRSAGSISPSNAFGVLRDLAPLRSRTDLEVRDPSATRVAGLRLRISLGAARRTPASAKAAGRTAG